MGYYHVAQICLNGHCISGSVDAYPELSQKFCCICGLETITNCLRCNATIRGNYEVPGVFAPSHYHSPAYCHECGKPYPWTEAALSAAKELIQEDENLGDQEKLKLQESLPDLIVETPRTQLASTRLKKSLSTVGKFTAEGLRQFVIDFGCAAVLKVTGLK